MPAKLGSTAPALALRSSKSRMLATVPAMPMLPPMSLAYPASMMSAFAAPPTRVRPEPVSVHAPVWAKPPARSSRPSSKENAPPVSSPEPSARPIVTAAGTSFCRYPSSVALSAKAPAPPARPMVRLAVDGCSVRVPEPLQLAERARSSAVTVMLLAPCETAPAKLAVPVPASMLSPSAVTPTALAKATPTAVTAFPRLASPSKVALPPTTVIG